MCGTPASYLEGPSYKDWSKSVFKWGFSHSFQVDRKMIILVIPCHHPFTSFLITCLLIPLFDDI